MRGSYPELHSNRRTLFKTGREDPLCEDQLTVTASFVKEKHIACRLLILPLSPVSVAVDRRGTSLESLVDRIHGPL